MVEAIRPDTAFVYIFRREDGLFKVGFSANPKRTREGRSSCWGALAGNARLQHGLE